MDIEQIEETLQQYHFIEFALLFGSYANGTAGYLSDVDIAIESDKALDLLTYGEIVAELEAISGKKIDLVTTNALYRENPRLAYNITGNHKVLFVKNENRYIDFKVNSLKYYTDMQFMYRMFDDRLKERLKNGTFGKVKAS